MIQVGHTSTDSHIQLKNLSTPTKSSVMGLHNILQLSHRHALEAAAREGNHKWLGVRVGPIVVFDYSADT